MPKYTIDDVLVYKENAPSRDTVRKYYSMWREKEGIPIRCDNDNCQFHKNELIWNGQQLVPILDHTNGNNSDNRPRNLRYLCPNCDSQQVETRGGANRNRIIKSSGGFGIRDTKSGKISYTLPVETAHFQLKGNDVVLVHRDKDGNEIGSA